MTDVHAAAEELCSILINKYFKEFSKKDYNSDYKFEIVSGNKYYKIVFGSPGRSVHAFVDKVTGDLYKAAGWRAPAKGVRFNLLKDMEELRKKADWHGAYLYIR